MYLPTTHIAFSVIGAHLVSWVFREPLSAKVLLWGGLFGFWPDFDYLYYLSRYGVRPAKFSHEHRQALTHSLLPHIILIVIILLVWGVFWGLLYFLAILAHLILDSVHSPWGIRWLWPFSSRYYSLGLRSGLTSFSKKELDEITAKRSNRLWVDRFIEWDNPYFIFESLASLFILVYFIYFLLVKKL